MTFLESLLAWFGLSGKLVLASALGGFISLNFFDGLDAKRRWMVATSGAGLGIFGAPPLVLMSGVVKTAAPSVEVGVGLLLAMFGMSLASAIIKVIRETDWSDIVKGRLGKGGGA